MTVLFLSSDLIFSSRLAGAAGQLNVPIQVAASAASLVAKVGEAETPPLVILDLNTPGVSCGSLVPALRALPSPPTAIIAYGPHVHEARLAEARAAGCDEVMSRGQFNAGMLEVIRRHSEGGGK